MQGKQDEASQIAQRTQLGQSIAQQRNLAAQNEQQRRLQQIQFEQQGDQARQQGLAFGIGAPLAFAGPVVGGPMGAGLSALGGGFGVGSPSRGGLDALRNLITGGGTPSGFTGQTRFKPGKRMFDEQLSNVRF